MRRFPGIYQRQNGFIQLQDNRLEFYLDGQVIPSRTIRFANLLIKNVGLNSPTYLFSERTAPDEGFASADRQLVELLAQMGSHNAAEALGRAKKKGNRQFILLAAFIGLGLFFVVVVPLIVLNLPLSWLQNLVSYEDERSLLSSFTSEEIRPAGKEKNPEQLTRLYEFLRERNPELNEFPATFAISNMPMANAFTLPGGDIVFTDQLLTEARSVEEVVGVLGHELGHVRKRHILRSSLKGLGVFSGVVILQVLLGSQIANIIHMGANIGTLSYSREHEEEADRFSFEILHRAGVSPNGFVDFFKRLSEQEKGLPRALSLLSSHPLSDSRRANIEELMAQYPLEGAPAELPVSLKELQTAK